MRFCPFCSAENAQEATHCAQCARRLPALPRRRTEAVDESSESAPEPRRRTVTPAPRASTGAVMPAPHSRPASFPHVGPAAQRREPEPELQRPDGAPARRKTDLADEPEASEAHAPTELGPAIDRGEPTPPPPPPPPPAAERAASSPPPPPPPIANDRAISSAGESRAESTGTREPTLPEPPPTRVVHLESAVPDFRPPKLEPVPDVPEAGLINAARYALAFARARWQRRSVIKALNEDIRTETASLDAVLGSLGKQVRALGIDNRALAAENQAIDAAEGRRRKAEQSSAELSTREAEENAKFAEIAAEREAKVQDAEDLLEKAEREHGALEAQRRGLRDKRKQIEQRQKSYLKNAEDREAQGGKAQLGDDRMAMRRAAEDLRRDAAALDPERQDIERRLAALERPIDQALAKVEALKLELDSAKRSLNDAREGHRHRLAEIEAEQGRKTRELALADAEVQRRLVTLGTLVNLHRIDQPEFADLYARVDRLRGAIGAQSTEIDRLTAEREAYDKASLMRGIAVIAGGIVGLITLIVLLSWMF